MIADLELARTSTDPEAKRDAQRRLVQLGSLKIARVLIDGSDDDRLALWRDHVRGERVPATIVPVLLAALGQAPAVLERTFELARRRRAAELTDDELIAIGELAAAHAAAVPLREALALCEWGLEDAATWLRGPGPIADRFTRAAVRALDGATVAALEEVRWSGALQRLFAIAATDAAAAALIDRWLADPKAALLVTQGWFDAHGQLDRLGDHARLVTLVASAWARSVDRAALAAALAEATARNRGAAGTGGLADWAWARLCDHPAERALVYRAFHGWRDALIERRNATPAARRPGGGSAVEHLAVWGALDLERLPATIEEAARLARPSDWPALVSTTFAIADAATTPGDRLWGLVGACRVGHEIANRVRDRDAAPVAEHDAAAALWRELAHRTARQLRDDGLVLDRDLGNRADELEGTIELIDREQARRAEQAADHARRAADAARRAADEARREDERVRREAEAAARAAADEARRAAQPPPPSSGPRLEPQGPPDPIDREPFFVHLALPTLVDYTRAMARLQRGADVMALFAELGLDATSWSTCVQTWSALFTRRPELAMRFAALLSGPWA